MNRRKAFQAERTACAKRKEGFPEGGGWHCRTSAGWWDTRAEDKEAGPLAGNLEFIQALEQKDQIPVLTAVFTSVDCRDDQA